MNPEIDIAGNLQRLSPADLAKSFSRTLVENGTLDSNERFNGGRTIGMLQNMAEFIELDMVGASYLVQSERSVLLPAVLEPGKDVTIVDFPKLDFEGKFSEYAIVRLQSAMGKNAVRALCLEFSDVVLLPDGDRVDESMTLFVPAEAVTAIDRIAA